MAVAFRSEEHTTYASRTSSVTVNAPAGVANDDIVLLYAFSKNLTMTPPAGFTAVPFNSSTHANNSIVPTGDPFGTNGIHPQVRASGGDTFRAYLWWKRAASEGASYTVTFTGTNSVQAMVAAYSGCETNGLPFAGTASQGWITGSEVPRASCAATSTLSVYGFGALGGGGGSLTPPAGYTERVDADQFYLCDAPFTGPGTITAGAITGTPGDTLAFTVLLMVPQSPTDPYVRSISGVRYVPARDDITLNAPIDIQDGDILLLFALVGDAGGAAPTITPPSGFTAITLGAGNNPTTVTAGGFNVKFFAWWKRASSEGSTYLVDWTGNFSAEAMMLCIRGAKASGDPTNIAASATGTGSTTTGPSITTTVANTLLVLASHDFTGGIDTTPPTGMSEAFDSGPLMFEAFQAIAATGATGTRTFTNPNSGGGDPWAAFMIAIEPDAGGGAAIAPLAVHHRKQQGLQ